MVKLAELSNKKERFDNDNTIKAITCLFPELDEHSTFLKAMSLVSEQRRLSAHAVRLQSQKNSRRLKHSPKILNYASMD
jgi:hypothetical protein